MLEIDGNAIRLTRGDTAYLEVPILIQQEDGTTIPYDLGEADILTLTVKKTTSDKESIIKKENVGSNNFHIKPEETANLEYGRYLYDVQLTTESGDVYTVIVPTPFTLTQEVTF